MGFATPADENLRTTLSIDDWLIENREASFMLQVQSDSMHDAGIYIGDMLIVERINTARPGQIIIVNTSESWSMQYFSSNKSEVLEIAAVVKAVIRKYK